MKEYYPQAIKSIVEFVKVGGHRWPTYKKYDRYLELGIYKPEGAQERYSHLYRFNFEFIAPLFSESYAVDIDPTCYDHIKHIKGSKWFNMLTDDFIANEMPQIGKVDVVFIDADHSFDQSFKDFIGMAPYVAPEGLVFLHDTYPPIYSEKSFRMCSDTWRTAEKIRDDDNLRKDWEIITLPGWLGLSVLKKIHRPTLQSHRDALKKRQKSP